MEQFNESEMIFGPYTPGQWFQVDGSAPHRTVGEGVKMIDFYKLDLVVPAGKLWLVEAKRSTPNANQVKYQKAIEKLENERNRTADNENSEDIATLIYILRTNEPVFSPIIPSDYRLYISDICDKMQNGLSLFFSTRAGRQPSQASAWPEAFMTVDTAQLQVRILLIVKSAQKRWLPNLQEALKKAMRPAVGTWGLGPDSIIVLNEDGARQKGFVSDPISP